MKRLVAIMFVLLVALAAPAQVWCQATCAAHTHDATTSAAVPHCPSHDQAPGSTMAGGQDDQCRAPETSRSGHPVRTFALGGGSAILVPAWSPTHVQILAASWAPPVGAVQASAFNHTTPLRI